MLWLFVAVIAVAAPLVLFLPAWVPAVPLVGLIWRIGIYRGMLGTPGLVVRVLLVMASVAGLGFTFNRLYGLEPMASLLVCAFGLKLLEIRHRRDALVVVYLGYFVAAVLALFDQTILAGGYLLLAFGLVTAALAGIHQTEDNRRLFRPLRRGVTVLLQALPLMVIFFLVMPRLGPFWNVPSPKTAVTGMSDHLAIGDITDLGRSVKTAFRVSFDGEVPPRDELYWRGLTFSRFDGKTWRPQSWGFRGGLVQWHGERADWWQDDLALAGQPSSYEVVLERQNGQWLFNLLGSRPQTPDTGVTRMQTLIHRYPLNNRFQYRASFWPRVGFQVDELSAARRELELRLPEGFNPRARELAAQWARQSQNDAAIVARALDFYRASFAYTLQPPALGRDSIDEFLFSSRRGFCEHFASSFVFLMRAAGVPARLVVGYQGGEVHPEEGHLTVRQYDAHAWAEVWLAGRGWVRQDPTAVVAPDRISQGLISMMTAPVVLSANPMNLDNYRDVALLNQLRLYLDSVDYAWGKWVLGYQSLQTDFMSRLLGGFDFQRIVLFVLAGSLVALLPALIYALWPAGRRRRNPLDRYYEEFCRRMARRGCTRRVGETPRHFARRCADHLPQQRAIIDLVSDFYERGRYGGEALEARQLRRLVRQL